MVPLFAVDARLMSAAPNRARFLLESLADLRDSLRARGPWNQPRSARRAGVRHHPEHAEKARVADIDDDLAQVEGQTIGRLLPGPANDARNRGAGAVGNEALI